MILAGDYIPEHHNAELNLGPNTIVCVLEGPILPKNHGLKPAVKSGLSLHSISLPTRSHGSQGQTHYALANNHFMDFGVAGLERSVEQLRRAGSKFAGAGHDVQDARRPMTFETDGVRVGLVSCCEAQYGIATAHLPGVAAVGPWVHSALAELRCDVDIPIVSVHAAVEMSPWPSPYLQQLYRSWIDAGAKIVHGHHAHQPQGVEHYAGGIIIYGSANMLVSPGSWANGSNTFWSVAVDIDLKSQPLSGRVFSIEIRNENGKLIAEPSTPDEQESHREYLEAVTAPLTEPALLEALWQETSVRATVGHYADPLRAPTGIGRRFTWKQRLKAARAAFHEAVGAVCGFELSTGFARRSCLNWHHYFSCISHREAIATGLGVLSGAIPDVRTETSSQLADKYMPFFPRVGHDERIT